MSSTARVARTIAAFAGQSEASSSMNDEAAELTPAIC
jgi:hypothetical protein